MAGEKEKRKWIPNILETLCEKDLEELKSNFDMFDKDKNGKISSDELAKIMQCMGQNPTTADVDHMMEEYDTNNDGVLTLEEFAQIYHENKSANPQEDLKEAFKVFDKDRNGYITKQELLVVLKELDDNDKSTMEEVEEMIKKADKNGDGKIEYSEFSALICE